MQLRGIDHVTLVCGDLERSTTFYRDVLGLTLLEEVVNPDDPGARHFWFGDASGTPGTLVSLMEYPDLPDARAGRGAAQHLAFTVGSVAELRAWRDWLRSRGIDATEVLTRGALHSVYLKDPDGMTLELLAR